MRIACLDHPYHEVTGSTAFVPELLGRLGAVDTYFPELGAGETAPACPGFDPTSYDVIVVLQIHEAFGLVPREHPNVVFIPMYDSHIWDGCFYWSRAFERAKILCFSAALHDDVSRRTQRTAWFQYFPDPEAYAPVEGYDAPRGFYWMRRNALGPDVVARLAAGTDFREFHVHVAPDPGEAPPSLDPLAACTEKLETTSWFGSRQEYLALLRQANVYFAPRRFEGIGLGFLEAMAMGLCVVAPDTPTHNEYISPGVNGVLYDLRRPEAADLSRFTDLGRRARESIARGRQRWEAALDDLFDFILTPTAEFRRSRFVAAGWLERPPRSRKEVRAKRRDRPPVAVVVPCPEPAGGLRETLESVLAQDYPTVECLLLAGKKVWVPAGLSGDGTRVVLLRPPAGLTAARAVELAMERSAAGWFLMLEPGTILSSPEALERLLANAPASAAIVYGHYLDRSAAGADEYFRTAGTAELVGQLRRGAPGVRWLAAAPAPSAIAWSRPVWERHRPDAGLQAAGWVDLLFRAYEAGCETFHADEVVSARIARPAPGRPEDLSKWIELARRYGGDRAAGLLRTGLGLEGPLGRRAPGRKSASLHSRPAPLRWLPAWLGGAPALQPAPLDLKAEMARLCCESYPASFEEGADFSRPGLPDFMRSVRGLSLREDWGRWSDGDRVEFEFRWMLPKRFSLLLGGYAVGDNAGRPIRVTAGGCTRELRMEGPPARGYRLRFRLREPAHVLVFEIPHPATRAELWSDRAWDPRELGIAFERLAIRSG